jgi:hypothetical protein
MAPSLMQSSGVAQRAYRSVLFHARNLIQFLSLAISQSVEPIAEGGMHRRSLSSLFTRISDGSTWTTSAI